MGTVTLTLIILGALWGAWELYQSWRRGHARDIAGCDIIALLKRTQKGGRKP